MNSERGQAGAPATDPTAPRAPMLVPSVLGYYIVPRWQKIDVYLALGTAAARHVAERILFERPRYSAESHFVAGELFQVSRGQLFDSEETLAKECGTTRKVVRRVLDLLEKFGLIEVEKGHRQGRHPRRVTVRDYEVSQRIRGERASDRANKGARTSPTKGPKETEENETNETNCDALVEKIGSTWAAEMRGLGQPSGEIKQRLAGVRAEREGDSLRLLVATSYGRDYLEQFHVQLAAAARKALGEAVTLEIVAPMTGDGR